MFGKKQPQGLRDGFAAKAVVIQEQAKDRWNRGQVRLARLWRRDADRIRRHAVKVERRAAKALHHGWNVAWSRARKAAHAA